MSLTNVKTPNIIPIQQVVYSVLNEMGIYSKENYLRFYQLAIDGIRDLNLYSAPCPEVEYLTMTANGIINLPQDCVDIYKVGIRRNGRVWTLTRVDDLLLPRTEVCGDVTAEETFNDHAVSVDEVSNSNSVVYYTPHFFNGQFIDTLYGAIGGINTGYFRHDKERNQLVISKLGVGTTIILEYKSTGISLSQPTLIPTDARPYVVAYVHWKRIQFDRAYNASERAEAKQNFIEAEESFRTLRYLSFSTDDYLDALYSDSHGSVRR